MPVHLRNGHGLDHRETFGRSIGKVLVGLLAIEPMEQLPRRVAKIEERRPVFMRQESLVLRDLEHAVLEYVRQFGSHPRRHKWQQR
jgi:hypothetical protein